MWNTICGGTAAEFCGRKKKKLYEPKNIERGQMFESFSIYNSLHTKNAQNTDLTL